MKAKLFFSPLRLLNSGGGVYRSFTSSSRHTHTHTATKTHTFSVLTASSFTISVGKINVFSGCQGCVLASTREGIHIKIYTWLLLHTVRMHTHAWTHVHMGERNNARKAVIVPESVFFFFYLLQIQYWWIVEEEEWRYRSGRREENRNTLIIKRAEKKKRLYTEEMA